MRPGVESGTAAVDLVAECGKYLPLARHAVAQYASRLPGHVDVDDLSGAAVLGLVEAARRFDASLGVPFEAWALQRIRGAILDAARSADFASRRTRGESRRLERAVEGLAHTLGRAPTDAEVTAELGMTLRELFDLRSRVHGGLVLSIDVPFADGEAPGGGVGFSETLVDADLQPLEALERRELDAYVRDCVSSLPDRLRWLVEQHFFEGRPAVDLAGELGVSESRVSQLKTEAMRLLEEALGEQYREIRAATERPASTGNAGPSGSSDGSGLSRRGAEVARAAAAKSTYSERLTARPAAFL